MHKNGQSLCHCIVSELGYRSFFQHHKTSLYEMYSDQKRIERSPMSKKTQQCTFPLTVISEYLLQSYI